MKIIKISDHDYDPNWDYNVVKVNKEIQEITQKIIQDISSNLLPKLNMPPYWEVHFVKNIKELGKYISGTSSKPIVVLDINNIQNAVKKYNVNIETAIETTITHELGHAMQEKMGISSNDKQAEELAYQWNQNKQIPNWIVK